MVLTNKKEVIDMEKAFALVMCIAVGGILAGLAQIGMMPNPFLN